MLSWLKPLAINEVTTRLRTPIALKLDDDALGSPLYVMDECAVAGVEGRMMMLLQNDGNEQTQLHSTATRSVNRCSCR
jgi:hypothetical protein